MAGFACAILVVLVAANATVYWRVEYALDRALDTELADATKTISPLVSPSGEIASQAQADATGVGWQIISPTGEVTASGGRLAGHSPVPEADLAGAPRSIDLGSLVPISPDPLRLRITRLPSGYLVVAVDRARRDEALRELLVQLAIAGVGTLLIASLVGDLLARGALRPVERYRAQAARIAGGSAELRLDVPDDRDDEVTRLGHTLNDMLGSLEAALDHERHFVNEASHELRTPVTVIAGRIEHARRKTRTLEEHELLLDKLAVDARRLMLLTEELLSVGARHTEGTTDVIGVVRTIAETHAGAGHVPLVVEAPPSAVAADISTTALERIITNLVDNALKHGNEPIHVHVRVADEHVVVEVADDGPGMPPDLLARATERFARSDEARSRPGSGLGLALVRQLAVGAGGELRLCSHGAHVSFGPATGIACSHDARTSVTVFLPRRTPTAP